MRFFFTRRAPLGVSFDAACILILLALIALRPLLTPVAPHDFWWHLATARDTLRHGAIPRADAFSWTQNGQPFYNQSWLAQLIFYALHALGGIELLVFAQAAVIACAYGLLLWFAVRRTNHARAGCLALVGVMLVSFDNWLIRPQSYALPVFAAFFVTLGGYRLGWWKRLWPLPLLMVLWVNLHGSFVLGLALVALTLLGEWMKWRKSRRDAKVLSAKVLCPSNLRALALWSALTALAVGINPRGFEVLRYVGMMLRSPSNAFSAEWLSPTPRNFNDALFFAFMIALFVFLIHARARPDCTELLITVVFLWLALTSGRYIVWFAMTALAPLASALAERIQITARNEHRKLNLALVAIVWLMLIPALPWLKPALGLPPQLGALVSAETPVRAVKALRALPPPQRPQRLFHSEATGSYLTWAAPEQKVFIDTRFELYPVAQWHDALALRRGDDVENIMNRYGFDGLLLEPQPHKVLLQALDHSHRWRAVYRDAHSVLLIRTGS